MSETPKRRFWHIHLSTCVVLMLVSGNLSYLNVVPRIEGEGVNREDFYGWPLVVVQHSHNHDYEERWYFRVRQMAEGTKYPSFYSWEWLSDVRGLMLFIGADVTVSMSILTASAGCCEWLIRRREAREP